MNSKGYDTMPSVHKCIWYDAIYHNQRNEVGLSQALAVSVT